MENKEEFKSYNLEEKIEPSIFSVSLESNLALKVKFEEEKKLILEELNSLKLAKSKVVAFLIKKQQQKNASLEIDRYGPKIFKNIKDIDIDDVSSIKEKITALTNYILNSTSGFEKMDNLTKQVFLDDLISANQHYNMHNVLPLDLEQKINKYYKKYIDNKN